MAMLKKKRLQKAFVVTTAAIAVGGPVVACDDGLEPITNPPFVECPFEPPERDDPCAIDEANLGECSYPATCITATCMDDIWNVEPDGMVCKDPQCPPDLPTTGDACSIQEQSCGFDVVTACGKAAVFAVCGQDDAGDLVFTLEVEACTPPTPACLEYDNMDLCLADTTCRYLTPGCGEPGYPFTAGCYPVDDCAPDGCEDDETCETIDYDPCGNSGCDACGAEGTICVAGDR